MEPLTLATLVMGALTGGFVTGLSGFGTALMALGIWLYVVPPSVAVPLVLISSIAAQTSALPSMWRLIDFKLAWPFIVGGLAGVPLGTLLVAHADPRLFKLTVGVILLIFPTALYLYRDPVTLHVGRWADAMIGFAGGILGGLAGLSGPIPTLWANMRAWTKDQRRGIFQAFNLTILGIAFCLQAGSGLIPISVVKVALFTLPGTLIGAWAGAQAYHALSDRNFRDIVLGLLFLSGVGLVWSSLG